MDVLKNELLYKLKFLCMNKFKSCRFSRILEKRAVMRASDVFIYFFITILMAVVGAIASSFWAVLVFGVIGAVIFLQILGKIFLADDYFELKKFNKKGKVKIYVYEYDLDDANYQVYVEYKGITDILYIDSYEFFKIGDKRDWFIFALNEDWYCQYFDKTIALGKRVGRAIFVDKGKNDNFFRVNALSLKNEIKTYEADKYYCKEDLLLPDLADTDDKRTDYMLIKVGLGYKVISSIHVWKKKREMMLAGVEKCRSAVFVDEGETVVIVWDEQTNSYKEIYRVKNAVSSLKYFVEMHDEEVPGEGSVYKFDKHKKSVKEVYRGKIIFIDEKERKIYGKKNDDVFSY